MMLGMKVIKAIPPPEQRPSRRLFETIMERDVKGAMKLLNAENVNT